MKAIVVYSNEDSETIEVNGHHMQFGGMDGDRYCYAHQSFECHENLTDEEWKAVQNAEYTDEES